ncbi:acyl-ACP--UDP-N-acetylglucosamine O-acyltransferase [Verrucomicrobiaceae bacterium R5-34]|uniref:Acyl-[acyl-carrier-protein]--UDP-N-acetylglucosamine O-acyltransferase n=1 Tax=Oceaniferula flava TaxID=2800421 RepID=A0AAE2VD06_9BACT|nr:acyl-ACP--UDP-N-acetylglucosamine O-acyltransferase [Oceaniferula flavus]MBK1832133.1 acyl-ACP--UDP-N-acetylglucosamine O-acyltransferase [Verrucomicrobiaceae bacterium R5-34]MBK1856245.1 acyl-ACP--UDP-N-acetylglucosamine O-acyltransferase [Oceaniferula flavus]MBM1137552.1 acyl-ACP--UDP-N-acetylglucosamine O-acyltransferase [Oceaniferula flavus]
MIHSTAIIDPAAEIADGVEVGAYCVVGANVSIGKGSVLKSHVVIEGHTSIGENNIFFPFSAIGQITQDLKYVGEPTALHIGDHNTFRENTTIHRGTTEEVPTTIGSHNLFLSYSHVAHDCQVGNHCILSNNGTLGGHCTVGDHAIISGLSGAHQFCHIGEHALVGGCTKIVQDVPPYMIVDGNPAAVRSPNLVGLQRRGFSEEARRSIKNAYRKLFLSKKYSLTSLIDELEGTETAQETHVKRLIEFIRQSERGVIR